MVRALRNNEIVWYAPDQSFRKKGAQMVRFFGTAAATNTGTSRLAQLTGASILYFSHERLPNGAGYRIVIHPPASSIPSDDAIADTEHFNCFIESEVRRLPEHYWWIHKRFKGLIIVQKESPIRTIGDLRGKRFAFGDPNSTIGRYLVQAELIKAGITGRALKDYQYLGRHDTVVKAVEIGDFDAGSVMQQTFDKANAKGTLRVLASFDNVTKPWVARKDLDPATLEAIRSGLYSIKDPAVLKELKITGFVPTSDEEYRLVRDGMKLAEEFESPRGGN